MINIAYVIIKYTKFIKGGTNEKNTFTYKASIW